MPCPAWGISCKTCKTGQKLAKIEGSTCSGCYANRGHYQAGNVRRAHDRRLHAISDPGWEDALCSLISYETNDYFRWFDSGDLQSREHLDKIIRIAERLPHIQFWLPTQERRLVADVEAPDNLTIRVSSVMIGKPDHHKKYPISSVEHFPRQDLMSKVLTSTKDNHYCPAELTDHKCPPHCRACWDKEFTHIIYRKR